MSILIKNASYIVTQNKDRQVLNNYDILIEGNRIAKIQKNINEKVDEIIDGKNKAVLPGLINLHTHSAMTLFRGIADDLDLFEWLEKKIDPLENKMSETDVYYGALVAAIEMIKSGTTSFFDMYFMMDQVAKACKDTGIRGFLSVGLASRNRAPEEIEKKIIDCENFIKKWDKDELITPSIGPHSVYTCSPEFLKKLKVLADKYNVLLHIHLSETKKEVEDSKKDFGVLPTEHLDNLKLLSPQLIVAHAIWLTEREMDLLKIYDVKVAHCPISNLKLGSGLAPIHEMRQKGITVGLGSDSVASNNNFDLFEEMKFSALLQKGKYFDSKVISAQEALDMATIGGAKSLQMENKLGSIEEGKLADLILIDLEKPHFTPIHNIISHLVYSATGSDVSTTIINGKVVMKDRKVLTVNENEILRKTQDLVEDLIRR